MGFTPEEAKLLWTGAMVERQHCTRVVAQWGERHGVSGTAFDELVSLIKASKDPVTGEPDLDMIAENTRLKTADKIMRDVLFMVAEATNSGASVQDLADDAIEAIRAVDKL